MDSIVNVNNVSKKYRLSESFAVEKANLVVKKGEIIGILGPNGAGKSTLIKMILGVISPTKGSVKIFEKEALQLRRKDKAKIGVFLGGKSNLIMHLPVMDTLRLNKAIYHISNYDFNERIEKYSNKLQCKNILEQRVGTLSLGQKLKAEILSLLIFTPELFVLDEPTLGLDIEGKRNFRNILRQLAVEDEISIIMTSHDVNDIEKVCDRIVFINKGKLIWEYSIQEIEELLDTYKIIITSQGNLEVPSAELIEMRENQFRYRIKTEDINLIKNQNEDKIVIKNATLEDWLYEYYR